VKELLDYYFSKRSILKEIKDPTERYAVMIGLLNDWFTEKNLGYLVITGGFAVELLTGSSYRTIDVDIITSNPLTADILEEFLAEIGEKIGRGYLPYHEEIALKSIEIVSTAYTRRKKPVKIMIRGFEILIDPPEDLIIGYLAAWKYWESDIDKEKALLLLVSLYEVLDYDYLRARAREEKVEAELELLSRLARELVAKH